MAEEGVSGNEGDDVIGETYSERGQEQADDSVAVEPGENAVRHPRDRACPGVPDRVAEEIDPKHENHRGEGVPDRNVKELFLPGLGRFQEVVEGKDEGHQHADVHRPDILGVFPALVVPHQKSDVPNENPQVPDPVGDLAEPPAVQGSAGQVRHVVEHGPHQGGAGEPEDHGVGVDRPQPAEDEPGDVIVQPEFRGDHPRSEDEPTQGGNDEPDRRSHKPAANRFPGFIGFVLHNKCLKCLECA